MRPIALLLTLALLAQGCVTKTVKKALAEETQASLSVSSSTEVLTALLPELTTLHKVGVNVQSIETGVQILRIVGAYAEVLQAIQWLILQNLRLLANDEVTKSLLAAALK